MLVDESLEVGTDQDGVRSLQINTAFFGLSDLGSMTQFMAVSSTWLVKEGNIISVSFSINKSEELVHSRKLKRANKLSLNFKAY